MAERSLGQWLTYLEALHPKAIDLGLRRVAKVAREMALVPCPYPVLTVAGTNGKGSVAHVSDALFRSRGLRCGRYTSPHLLNFNERICVDGIPAVDADLVAAFAAIEAARGSTTLTYFEFATLAALYHFRAAAVDVAVLEVGLGGRLDAVNVVDAEVAVITSIALDHQEWLGNSRESIGREKAAVARPGRPVVLAEEDYPASVEATLKDIGAGVVRAGESWLWRCGAGESCLAVELAGGAQRLAELPVPQGLRPANVAAALQAVALMVAGRLDQGSTVAALQALRVPARRQRLQIQGRELVLDVAHNPQAMAALAEWLMRDDSAGNCYAALGLMSDKDLPAIASVLAPAVRGACAVALPAITRAQTPERIWQVLDSMGIATPQSEFTVEAVWDQLLAGSDKGDRLVFCGSFHTVAGIMTLLDIRPDSP